MALFDRDRLINKRPKLFNEDEEESNYQEDDEQAQEIEGADLSQLNIGNEEKQNSPSGNDLHSMIEKWKHSIQSDEAQRRMLENYIRAYVDVSDEEMDEILSQHGF